MKATMRKQYLQDACYQESSMKLFTISLFFLLFLPITGLTSAVLEASFLESFRDTLSSGTTEASKFGLYKLGCATLGLAATVGFGLAMDACINYYAKKNPVTPTAPVQPLSLSYAQRVAIKSHIQNGDIDKLKLFLTGQNIDQQTAERIVNTVEKFYQAQDEMTASADLQLLGDATMAPTQLLAALHEATKKQGSKTDEQKSEYAKQFGIPPPFAPGQLPKKP
jgi:hypothetical protein